MLSRLPNPQLRRLKAAAQHLQPTFHVGKAGLSPQFVDSIDIGLRSQELIKIRFSEFKEDRKQLARELAEKTNSHLVMQVGHVIVLYREKPIAGET